MGCFIFRLLKTIWSNTETVVEMNYITDLADQKYIKNYQGTILEIMMWQSSSSDLLRTYITTIGFAKIDCQIVKVQASY